MGAWDVGPFDNDDALDWLMEAEESPVEVVTAALSPSVEEIQDPDPWVEQIALAAAALVAGAIDSDVEAVTRYGAEDAKGVIEQLNPKVAELAPKALAVIELITTKSELRSLFEESDLLEQWMVSVNELKARLQKA